MPNAEDVSATETSSPAPAEAPGSGNSESVSEPTAAPVSSGPDYAKLYEESSSRLKQLEEYVPKLHSVFEKIQAGEEARLRALGMLPTEEKPQYLTRGDFEKFSRGMQEERARERAEADATREIEDFMSSAQEKHPDVFDDPDLRDLFYARVAQSPTTPLDKIADGIVRAVEARQAKWLENYGAGKSVAPRIVKSGSAGGKPPGRKPDLGDQETRIAAILSDIGASA